MKEKLSKIIAELIQMTEASKEQVMAKEVEIEAPVDAMLGIKGMVDELIVSRPETRVSLMNNHHDELVANEEILSQIMPSILVLKDKFPELCSPYSNTHTSQNVEDTQLNFEKMALPQFDWSLYEYMNWRNILR